MIKVQMPYSQWHSLINFNFRKQQRIYSLQNKQKKYNKTKL